MWALTDFWTRTAAMLIATIIITTKRAPIGPRIVATEWPVWLALSGGAVEVIIMVLDSDGVGDDSGGVGVISVLVVGSSIYVHKLVTQAH